MTDDFFIRLERQLQAAELGELKRAATLRRVVNPRGLLAAAAGVGVVVVVLAVLGAIAFNDADRRPRPVGKVPAPRMEVLADAIDAQRGIQFNLDGRVLTVALLPQHRLFNRNFETVEGARISATCGAPQGETTLTRRWPPSQTSTSYRFPGDVSSWCRLEDQSGSTLAFVRFPGPGVPPGAREQITETANNWARAFASTARACNEYTTWSGVHCEQVDCEGGVEKSSEGCRPSKKAWRWAAEHRGATVQRIAISGDRAAAMLTRPGGIEVQMVQLRRTATGQWLIDRLGPIGAVGSL
jgi:hypothetical protein